MKNTVQFDLGRVLATRTAVDTFSDEELRRMLIRHAHGDWGNLKKADKRANDEALLDGSRILSRYDLENGRSAYIITDAEDDFGRRLHTTICLPSEY